MSANLKVPKHIGIIPDGNRRWAREHGLVEWKGHDAGIKKLKEVIEWARAARIQTLTVWGFSTENFDRPSVEKRMLFKMLKDSFLRIVNDKDVHQNKIRIRVLGRKELLPQDLQDAIKKAENSTKEYSNFNLNICLAYGGRQEILDATREISESVKSGKIGLSDINEELFSHHTYLNGGSSPDLVIRTSGEYRTSGFLLWNTPYSEFVFLKKYFPALEKNDFLKAINEYGKRERRFGR